MHHLIIISGPTAVGKTALSVSLAKHYSCPILSADSRQIYKYLNIGTAKPSIDEMSGVTHYFIDHVAPDVIYNAGLYEQEVLPLLVALHERFPVVIMTGGTGLYIDAVTEGLNEFPEIPDSIRTGWRAAYERKGIKYLQEELKKTDLNYYLKVDLSNARRLLRALELIEVSGRSYSSFLDHPKAKRPFHSTFIQLDRPRDELYNRINNRVDEMMHNGFLKEVQSLVKYRGCPSMDTVGYRELLHYIDGEYSFDQAVDEMKKWTRRYAKRQWTWFRRSDKWNSFHPDQIEDLKRFIEGCVSP